MNRSAVVLVTTALILTAGHAQADGFDKQSKILLRAISYDNNLKLRAGDELIVGVLVKPGAGNSESAASRWMDGLRPLSGVKVQGVPSRSVRVEWQGADRLKTALASAGIDVLLITEGHGFELGAIISVCRELRVLTAGGAKEVLDGGVSLSVFGDTSVAGSNIVVNLAQSRAEGVAFGSELLSLARVIR